MQGRKNWILPKETNANRFFWDSHWLEIWTNHLRISIEPNGRRVAMDLVDRQGRMQLFVLRDSNPQLHFFSRSTETGTMGGRAVIPTNPGNYFIIRIAATPMLCLKPFVAAAHYICKE